MIETLDQLDGSLLVVAMCARIYYAWLQRACQVKLVHGGNSV